MIISLNSLRLDFIRIMLKKFFFIQFKGTLISKFILLGIQISSVRFFVHLFQNKMNERIN